MLWFFTRTGINLSESTVTDTKISGVKQINPGIKLF